MVSPCVTFNDHVGTSKCYKYVHDYKIALQWICVVPDFEEVDVVEEFAPGSAIEVEMHDGSRMWLGKLRENRFPPTAWRLWTGWSWGWREARP